MPFFGCPVHKSFSFPSKCCCSSVDKVKSIVFLKVS
jgi:hypothetical protein